MSLAQSLRPLVPLVIGLLLGGVGSSLFQQSMPGAEGSPEQRANRLEVELKSARNRIAALEAADPQGRRRPGRTFADGARGIAEDIRDGKPVSPDDIFRASQPLMRDLAPLFDRMRVRQQRAVIDSKAGELARKYDLTPGQQAAVKQWFEQKFEEQSKRYNDLVARDDTRLQDLMKASMDARPDEGLDEFMAKIRGGCIFGRAGGVQPGRAGELPGLPGTRTGHTSGSAREGESRPGTGHAVRWSKNLQ